MINYSIFYILLGFIYIFSRYIKSGNIINFYCNPFLYLFGLSLFYLILPCVVYEYGFFRLIIFDEDIIEIIYIYCYYYSLVFFLFYLFNKDESFIDGKYINFQLQNKYIVALLSLSSAYILFICTQYINFEILLLSRVDKYSIYNNISSYPGFLFTSWFIIIWSFYLCVNKKKLNYILFIFPLIFCDLILYSRYYIFLLLIFLILFYSFVKKVKLNLVLLLSLCFPFFLISIIREDFENISIFDILQRICGEFINTWYSIGLVLINNFEYDVNPFIVLISRIIPNPFYSYFFGPKVWYGDKMGDFSNFPFGLGSSVITEGLVNGEFYALVFPIVIGFLIYLFFSYSRTNSPISFIIRFLIIANIYSCYRGVFTVNTGSFIMIFIFIFYVPFLFLRYLSSNK